MSAVWPKLAVYIALGFLLLALNVWYVRGLIRSFGSGGFLVAPIYVLGTAEDSQRGPALAHLLVNRLDQIESEIATANEALEPTEPEEGIGRQDLASERTLSFPAEAFRPLDLDVKVGGLELRGVLAWVQRSLVQDRILQLSLVNDPGRVRVSGNWNVLGIEPFWLEIDREGTALGEGDIVDAIAYEIAYHVYCKRVPETGALGAPEFRQLLAILGDLALLNSQVAKGRPPETDLLVLYKRLAPLADRAKKWSLLQRLTASLAERAGAIEEALQRYQAERARLAETPGGAPADLQDKIRKLEEAVEGRLAAALAGGDDPDPSVLSAEAEHILALLGVSNRSMTDNPPLVGIPGPAPKGPGFEDVRVLATEVSDAARNDEFMAEYIGTVISAVRLVAPKTRFVVAPIETLEGAGAPVALAGAVVALAREKIDVLLVPFGPLPVSIFQPLLVQVTEQSKITTVVAAGNRPGESIPLLSTELRDRVLFAAAVDLQGRAASFTQTAEECVWAPGADIPVQVRAGIVQPRSGTTYSAALAAGVAVRLLDRHRSLEPAAVSDLLRTSAVKSGVGPPILNLDRALARAREQ